MKSESEDYSTVYAEPSSLRSEENYNASQCRITKRKPQRLQKEVKRERHRLTVHADQVNKGN